MLSFLRGVALAAFTAVAVLTAFTGVAGSVFAALFAAFLPPSIRLRVTV